VGVGDAEVVVAEVAAKVAAAVAARAALVEWNYRRCRVRCYVR